MMLETLDPERMSPLPPQVPGFERLYRTELRTFSGMHDDASSRMSVHRSGAPCNGRRWAAIDVV
jgi:hypothetical protein